MINFLKGEIMRKRGNAVAVRVGDMGYEVLLSPLLAAGTAVGATVELITHLTVRDDSQELYGFTSFEELDFFRLLTSVSGVGPRSALNILSLGSIDDIQDAVSAGDVTYLVQVSGIGKKTAERIIVELRDKVGDARVRGAAHGPAGMAGDVVEALVAMGYKRPEAQDAVRAVAHEFTKPADMLKAALQKFSRH